MADIIRNEVIDAVLTRQTIREYKPIMLTDAQLDTLTAAAMMLRAGGTASPAMSDSYATTLCCARCR